MFQPLPLYIGLRYVRTRQHGFFVSFISWVSMLGVCLGVAALIVILSVMNGFESELRGRLLNLSDHATLTASAEQQATMTDWQTLLQRLRQMPSVVGAAPYLEVQGMLGRAGMLTGVKVRGIDPSEEPQVADVAAHMVSGSFDSLQPESRKVLLGATLAWQLQVQVGDELTVLIPEVLASGELRPRLQSFTVSGIFEFGAQEQDSTLALIHLADGEALAGVAAPTGFRLKFDDLFAAATRVAEVNAALGGGFAVSDWTRENASYFRAVSIEKTMMAVMLMLIVAIAAFNIIAALVMVVNEKRMDIAILRTLGLTPRQVVQVFITQGLMIGWIGVLVGVLLGLLLALNVEVIVPWLEVHLGMQFFDPTVYYITQIPSEVHAGQISVIALLALLLTAAATLYPARRAALVQPAEALRYE